MSGYQDVSQVRGTWDASRSAVVGFLNPHANRRRVSLMSISGPANSTLRIYRGYTTVGAPINSVFPADARTYDSTMDGAPMVIWPGEALTFAWSGGNAGIGQVGTATVTSEVDF